ncbi:MAG: hypothetical protein LBI81_01660 [Puniceicoccales bacterium]|jgi:phosphoglucosamine mutase|nr:hypothetical protein [Puniceicoccales bacterium]
MKYFGTDGIRGKYGKFPISEEFFTRLGSAIEKFFLVKCGRKNLTICVGRDTRRSGISLFRALFQGFSGATQILDCKILPTPAISSAVVFTKSDAGIVLTASHNPSSDNGVKIFNARGEKLSIDEEEEMEGMLEQLPNNTLHAPEVVDFHSRAQQIYCNKYKNFLPKGALSGKTIALDSANGATSRVAGKIFRNLGLNVIQIGSTPNGTNINENCGSEYPQNLTNFMKKNDAFAGIAFDGDGDRVVIFDETGEKIAGDVLIGRIAVHMAKKNNLPNGTIVTTIQSNMGLDKYLELNGIGVIRCDVGDRNVYQEMLKNHCHFGGENSGHLIFEKFSPIGDGITAALYVLSIVAEENIELSNLKTNIALFPQKSFNVPVSKKIPNSELEDIISKAQSNLSSGSRIVVRNSGTEPFLRITVEAESEGEVDHTWDGLKRSILERVKDTPSFF